MLGDHRRAGWLLIGQRLVEEVGEQGDDEVCGDLWIIDDEAPVFHPLGDDRGEGSSQGAPPLEDLDLALFSRRRLPKDPDKVAVVGDPSVDDVEPGEQANICWPLAAAASLERGDVVEQDLTPQVAKQLLFVLEVQVERSLCNARLSHNGGDGGLCVAASDEPAAGNLQEAPALLRVESAGA